jgi:hypothetical protein
VRFHTDVIAEIQARSDGSFAASGVVPESYSVFAPHQFTVSADGKESIRSDRRTFNLTG